jgi:hypothetical protein
LKEKLVEKGLFIKFENWAFEKWEKEHNHKFDDLSYNQAEFTDWLINPTRFCELAVQFGVEKLSAS